MVDIVEQGVHIAGKSAFDFTSPREVISCGQEGQVKLVGVDPLEDSGLDCHQDDRRQFLRIAVCPTDRKVFALAKTEDGFNSFVQLFTLGEETRDNEIQKVAAPGIRLTQTSLGVCDLAWSPDGVFVAVGTDSDGIKVMRVDDPVKSIKQLKDHEGAVKSVSFDPKGEYLASVGADGSLRIYSCKDWACIKAKKNFMERDVNAGATLMHTCKASWSQDGAVLAVPGASTLRVLKRDDWDDEVEFENTSFESAITITAFSSQYLAACNAETQPKLVVWNLANKSIAYSFENFNQVSFCDLKFACETDDEAHPGRLIGLNTDGELIRYALPEEPRVRRDPAPSSASSVQQQTDVGHMASMDVTQTQNEFQSQPDSPVRRTSQASTGPNQQDDMDDVEEDPESSVLRVKQSLGFTEDGAPLPNSGQFDQAEDDAAEHSMARVSAAHLDEEVKDLRLDVDSLRRQLERLRPPPEHESFQPSATQFGSSFIKKSQDEFDDDDSPEKQSQYVEDINEDEDRRFFVWNHVGSVVCRRDRDKQSIEIDFADASAHRPIRISDLNFFDKGALSEDGAFFSSTASSGRRKDDTDFGDDDDRDRPENEPREAVLHFRSFAPSPWNQHWTFPLGKKEQITAVACGNTFCAAATKRGYLRVFRHSGVQEPILALPGPVLSMTATGSFLLILFHATHRKTDHELAFQLRDMGEEGDARCGRIVAQGPLPCEQGVSWCGFADESLGFMPLVYRRDGSLLGLTSKNDFTWVVLSDGTGLDKGIRLWPISASRDGGLLAVPLRNRRKQPSVVPRSNPSLFAIRIPILRESNRASAIKYDQEELALRDELVLAQRKWANLDDEDHLMRAEAKADIETLRSFLVAVQHKEYARAFSWATRLRIDKSLDVAQKKATEAGADPAFLERLFELIDARNATREEEQQMEEDEAYEDEDQQYVPPTHQEDDAVEPTYQNEEEDDVRSVHNVRTTNNSLRVAFDSSSTPQRKKTRLDEESKMPESPFVDRAKKPAPPNPFLKSASPALREKRPQHRASPIRIPELSRQSSFTVEARSEYKRKL